MRKINVRKIPGTVRKKIYDKLTEMNYSRKVDGNNSIFFLGKGKKQSVIILPETGLTLRHLLNIRTQFKYRHGKKPIWFNQLIGLVEADGEYYWIDKYDY